MSNPEKKAVGYVVRGLVEVSHALFDTDGNLVEAAGTVTGTHVYSVFIDPTGTTCSCVYGQNRNDASGHSHDVALRIQAEREQE